MVERKGIDKVNQEVSFFSKIGMVPQTVVVLGMTKQIDEVTRRATNKGTLL